MTLKHMPPDQESHKHIAEISAFSPSPSYINQLILTTAFNSVYPQSQGEGEVGSSESYWTPPESQLDWQCTNANSFLREPKSSVGADLN